MNLEYTYFCKDTFEKGTVMCDEGDNIAVPFNKSKTKDVIGISINEAVEMPPEYGFLDFSLRRDQILTGSKIHIVKSGIITIRLPKKYKLPRGQNLYVSKKGKISWRRTNHYIGMTHSKQDADGFVNIEVKAY